MSYSTSLINQNKQPIYISESTSTNKQIPRWLLEFNSGINVKICTNNNLRPRTENNLRPKWFEELSQKRRMSDVVNVNGNINLFDDNQKKNPDNHKLEKYSLKRLNKMDDLIHLTNNNNDSKIKPIINNVNDVFIVEQSCTENKTNRSTNESKIETAVMNSNYFPDHHDEQLFSFSSSFKLIENLKLDEMVKTVDEDCIIPEMPTGKKMHLILVENWGDQHFIGLNGIEILDRFGHRPKITNVFLESESKNYSPENDLTKLIDNVYRTHDDAHIWQYRFEGKLLPIRIILEFDKPATIALIRIWNYNKSRIHSYRGVKYAKVKLDEQTIFCGEIAKASGDLTGSLENFGDTILFTTDDDILEQISHYDISFQELLLEQLN